MKKKLYLLSMVMILSLTVIGCGRKDAATDRKMAEAGKEITTEAVTEEKEVEKSEKKTDKKTEVTTEATTEKGTEDKKSDTKTKTDKKKSDAATQKAAAQPANENKAVVTTNSTGNTSSNTSANNTQQTTTQTTPVPQTTECQHNWVHHDAVMGERCVRPGTVAHWYCYNCQKYYISVWDDPCGAANGSDASYVLDPGEFENYEVSPAYDECSKCGARK